MLEVTRAYSTVFVSNVRSEHPNAKPKGNKRGVGEGEQRKPPTPLNGRTVTRVQFQKREWQLKEVMMVAIIL